MPEFLVQIKLDQEEHSHATRRSELVLVELKRLRSLGWYFVFIP